MKKNDEFIVTIDDVGINGEGIAHVDGHTIFVPFALKDEVVRVKVINTKTKFAICKVTEIINSSSYRVQPLCPYFGKCGGCDLQHIQYNQQLAYKKSAMQNTFSKALQIVPQINDIVPSDQYYYRNKISLPVVYQDGRTQIGLFRVNSHKVIELSDCVIQKPFVANLIQAISEYIDANNIMGYDEIACKGTLRHIVARQLNNTILITLVATTKLPNTKQLIEILSKYFENFGLNLNINSKKTNVIFGDKFIPLYGPQQLSAVSHGIGYPISAYSFMQINDQIREKIYNYVIDHVQKVDNVIDAYSGAGLLTAMLSKVCSHAYGIEIIESAVNDANQLAYDNNITNMHNILGDCAVELPKLLQTLQGNTSVVLDPPRKGCDVAVLNSVKQCSISDVIYISCNPATLARDLNILSSDYVIESVQPFDMFPNTKHVETVVVLKRR